MKYTSKEAFEEIKRRGRHLKYEHEVRIARLTGAISCATAVALLGSISVFSGSLMNSDASKHYGSFLLSAKSGIYVLLAVVFFVLGASTILAIEHFMKKKGFDSENKSGFG